VYTTHAPSETVLVALSELPLLEATAITKRYWVAVSSTKHTVYMKYVTQQLSLKHWPNEIVPGLANPASFTKGITTWLTSAALCLPMFHCTKMSSLGAA
jgi:hypothetical protein